MTKPMRVASLIRALSDLPPDALVEVEGCREGLCGSTIRSVEVESGVVDGRPIPVRVRLTRDV